MLVANLKAGWNSMGPNLTLPGHRKEPQKTPLKIRLLSVQQIRQYLPYSPSKCNVWITWDFVCDRALLNLIEYSVEYTQIDTI